MSRPQARGRGGNNSMAARMSRIEAALARMSVQPQSRRGGRGRSRSRSRSRSRTGPRMAQGANATVVRLATEEVLATLTATDATHSVVISTRPGGDNNSAGHLKALAGIYERMRWINMTVHYVGSVGSTVGGTVAIGIDYDADATSPLSLASVSAMTPNRQTAAFKNVSFPVAIRSLAPQAWMSTEGDKEGAHPRICVFATGGDLKGKGYGYIRITYTVEFMGFKLAQ